MRKTFLMKATICVAAMLLSIASYAQLRPLAGKVVDPSGEPIVGASVVVPGQSNVGTATGADGSFQLMVPAQAASVTISCIGYVTQTVPIAGRPAVNVTLEEDNEFLEETVVIGYGVQRKSDLTGAVASVRSADLEHRSVSSAAAALQGKAAGVQVYSNSGAPGESSHIRVRGISSNSGSGLGPLLIVDGLKVDNIQYLDPEMIESMEVLKDAASAAIYGAQAGNGVVLITTKSGSKSQDGQIFYNGKYSVSSLGHHAQVMNAEQYLDFQHTAGLLGTREEVIANGFWDGKTDTNWADVLFGRGFTHSHTVGAQGGNDRGSYFLSLNYTDENGMARGDKDYYKRLTAQINADYKIKSWIQVGTNTSIERYQQQSLSQGSEYAGSTLLGALIIDPLTPTLFKTVDDMPFNMRNAYENGFTVDGITYPYKIYQNEDGYWYSTSKIMEGDGVNPLINVARNRNKSQGFNVRGTVYTNITPFKDLVFTSRLGYRIGQGYNENYEEPYYVNPKNHSEVHNISANSSQNYFYQWENFANYNHNFGRHALGAMAGMSYTYTDSRNVGASLRGPDILKGYSENFLYLPYDNGKGEKGFSSNVGTPSNSSQISYFGRLTYSYDNRYSLQANFRADAFDSSKLSLKNRWGYFPSISAGWTISNESWFNVPAINFLKFRGSWGINGNIAVLNGYPYSTSISYNSKSYQYDVDHGETLSYGSQPDGLANPDLTWETSVQTDLGLDLRMFNNRFTFTFDWFNKNTEDLLVNISPVPEVGISSTTVNAGAINNTGLEFELGWQDHIGEFGYSINANLSTLKNNVTYLEPSVGHIPGDGFSNYKLRTYFQEGYPVWFLRGYEYAGMNGEGVAQYVAADGSLTTTPTADDLKFIGNTLPTYTYGVTLRMDWKGIDFTVFGTGAGGNSLVPCVFRTEHPQINSLEYFHAQAGKTIPTVDKIYNSVDFWSSSATVFKGDFFKIKQIQLGYTLPRTISSKIMISNLRLYASMDDWFVFTNYPGFDPETATTGGTRGKGLDKGQYPNAKKLLFGVNIAF